MVRSPCCLKEGLNKGAWTSMEDKILIDYIKMHGEGKWRNLPKKAGLKRCGKSCRLRWMNYLRPDIKRGNITSDEEELIIRLHKLLGNRWSLIAGRLPGRTDNEIKNYWNANLSKRVNQCNNQAANTLTTSYHNKLRNKAGKMKPLPTIDEPNTFIQPVESNVVRTKAVRCTKVFINPQLQPQMVRRNDATNAPVVQPSSNTYNGNNDPTIDRNTSPRLHEEYKMPSFELMTGSVDTFMGDFNQIADLLNSEFSSIYDFSNEPSSNDASELLSPNSPVQQPFVLSQEFLDDWLGDKQLM